MKFIRLLIITCLALSPLAAENVAGNWSLKESTVTYKASHTMKTATGISTKARGKTRCAAECEVLIAIPVVSFDSGDSNRDLHMLEATKGATFPVITVRARFKAPSRQGQLTATLDIEFAGKKALVKNVGITLTPKDGMLQAEGAFTVKMSDFGIARPSLFGMSIDDEVPITVQSTWETAK